MLQIINNRELSSGIDYRFSLVCVVYVSMCKRVCVTREDTLGFGLVDRLVRLVGVLHGNGMREFIEHALLEGFQALVVMTTTHKLLILQSPHTHTYRDRDRHTHIRLTQWLTVPSCGPKNTGTALFLVKCITIACCEQVV